MMKQAQAVQAQMHKLREEMDAMEINGESGAGLVTV
ncbi:MAG: YbaB/EbfC family nucleoid-associated protein, partial [Gammaproteobacteria bacterium]|nr:YbaB/EbfC family nucleoid-associated protein [Gammaproteobacteria bacterium]